jgi:7-cyano-7-deazaguanine synthase in queuosine biosynthesis
MSSLVLLSGGIDSITSLVYELEAGHEVCAYHLILKRTTNVHIPERDAVVNAIQHLKCKRGFKICFFSSVVDVKALGIGADLYVALGMMAANLCIAREKYTRIVTGWCKEDGEWGQRSIPLMRDSMKEPMRYYGRKVPLIECPTAHLSKAEMFDHVGPELAALAWGCEYPEFEAGHAVECGVCPTCTQYTAARQGGFEHELAVNPPTQYAP